MEQLGPCATTTEPLQPVLPKRSHCNEKPSSATKSNPHSPELENTPGKRPRPGATRKKELMKKSFLKKKTLFPGDCVMTSDPRVSHHKLALCLWASEPGPAGGDEDFVHLHVPCTRSLSTKDSPGNNWAEGADP